MEGSQNARGKGKQRKSIGETIDKDLEVNSLSIDMIYDWTLCLFDPFQFMGKDCCIRFVRD